MLLVLTYIFGSNCNWPPKLCNKLLCIKTYFNDVVQQCKQGSQWEGCNKQGYKSKLDD